MSSMLSKIEYLLVFNKIIKNPLDLVLQYLGLWKHPYIAYRMRAGDTIIARTDTPDDREMLREVFGKDNDYASYTPGNDDTVLDIGAYIGGFTLLAARTCKRVIAYEPHPDNFRLLNVNLQLNGLSRKAVAYPFAVSDAPGKKTLHVGDFRMGFSLYKDWGPRPRDGEIQVECITLSQVMESNKLDRVDLLKMDCEGAEYPIIMGADKKTLSKIRRMIIEHHVVEGHPREKMMRRLADEGFKVSVVKEEPGNSIVYATRD